MLKDTFKSGRAWKLETSAAIKTYLAQTWRTVLPAYGQWRPY
jgi:hypothetical protein